MIYSRPILLLVSAAETTMIVPGLEEAHANGEQAADHVLAYYEHPEMAHRGGSHLDHFDELLSGYPSGAMIGVEADACPLSLARHLERIGLRAAEVGAKIKELRYVKDAAEIEQMTRAGQLVNLAVRESLAACAPGATELEVDARGTFVLYEEAGRSHPGATLEAISFSPSGPDRSAWPHVFSNNRKLEEGDVLIHSRQVALSGYRAELERTVVIGEPTERQAEAFEAAREAQEAALGYIRPGVTASEVDEASRSVIRESGLAEHSVHRVGHGLGVSAHEEPYLRFDNDLVLREGMVFTIEPGVYISGVGGFRHSDPVVLTAEGSYPITEHPRHLRSPSDVGV